MINKTNIKIPKKYAQFIETVEKEYGSSLDLGNMYWAYPIQGYYFSDSEAHSVNGNTVTELLQGIRTIEKCNCNECAEYWNSKK